MAGSTNVYLNHRGQQALSPGENVATINDENDKSIVVGANEGVDLLATVAVKDALGHRYPGPVYSYFRVVSWKKDTPTTTASSRAATTGDQVSFKGAVSAVEPGRSARLRLVVELPDDAPAGLTLERVQVTGWTL